MELTRENVEYIQSACNPVAVARQFSEWCKEELHKTNSMDSIRDNPLLLGVLGKLCDMFKLDHDGERAYKYIRGDQ